MSLNLPQVLSQMQDMGRTATIRVKHLAVKLPETVETFRQVPLMKPKHLQARIARAGNRWPGAAPTQEPLDLIVSPPPLPDQLKVIGADGSQIYPDRHSPAFYLMPVVVRTRDYDQSFYAAIGVAEDSNLGDQAKRGIDSLYGE